MKRRTFLTAGCACGAGLFCTLGRAQTVEWQMPARFVRPDIASDEGGLWAIMDRAETKLRRSPFSIHDPKLQNYVHEIVCRLGGEHCLDLRVHLVHAPLFNANMAPNGMMQVWSGLLLRMENEAQLAAVLGHEMGHYLARHSVEQLRDAKSRSAFGQFLGLFGLAGAVGQVAMLAGTFAYSRDKEREADRIGVILMRRAGYDPAEAAKVWENLLLELKAKPDGDPTKTNPLFASHPPADERNAALAQMAKDAPGGATNEAIWQQSIEPFRHEWLQDEVKRGQYEESLALLTRMIVREPQQAQLLSARAEVYRLHAKDGDLDMAIGDYLAAVAAGGEPAETHRGLGMIYRLRHRLPEARSSFARYLQLAPDAPDYLMIKSYLEELGT